jgi:hypothetical protein
MVIDTVAIAGRPWELSAADRAASVLTIKAQGAAPPLASLQRIAVTLKSGRRVETLQCAENVPKTMAMFTGCPPKGLPMGARPSNV